MTLSESLEYLGQNPLYIFVYAALLPFAAFLAGILGKGEGNLSPWRFFYSALIFLVCIPGIFAIALNIYLFLFERRSIMDTRIYTQILPIFSMVFTLLIARRNVDFKSIPGFDKISGLVMVIAAVMMIMWFVDRTRIFIFSIMPIQQLLLIFVGLLVVVRLGWGRLMSGSK